MIRKFAVLVAVVLVGLGVPSVAASASPVPDLQCGVTPTTNVRLRHDLTCSEDMDLEGVGAITINLGGHTLTFTQPQTGPCIAARLLACNMFLDRHSDVAVRNGTVVGTIGIGSQGSLTHVHVQGHLSLFSTGAVSIRHDVIDGGISMEGGPAVIDHNVISQGIAFNDEDSGIEFAITNNVIQGTISSVLDFTKPDAFGTIARNFIWGSSGDGIDVDLSFWEATISDNLLINNAGDGIRTASGDGTINGSVTIKRNTAIDNGGHGFDLPAITPNTVIDGGHNVAVLNKTDPQCIGVVCKP